MTPAWGKSSPTSSDRPMRRQASHVTSRQADSISGSILYADAEAFGRQICEPVLDATFAPDGEDFRAAIRFNIVGSSGAAHLRITPGVLTRRGGRSGVAGGHFLVLVLRGSALLTAGEIGHSLSPNAVVVISGALGFSLALSAGESGSCELDLLQVAGAEPPALARASGAVVTTSAALADYIVGMAALVQPEDGEIGPCRRDIPIFDYIGAAIRDYLAKAAEEKGQSRDHGLYQRIRAFIARNVKNPALGADLLAREFAISKRKLYSVFYDSRASLHETIMTARLEAARREIEAGGQKVASVILDHGFSNPSTFYRNYKRHFGRVPRS
ncbi:helix-turn-helix domain-containing protein [Inquilinus limosus]|uniref:helix-turn-helix transcriptional regulator n=2 Tax=Inquilinus limosus TaxID=171674 RepID=UPI003F5CD99E